MRQSDENKLSEDQVRFLQEVATRSRTENEIVAKESSHALPKPYRLKVKIKTNFSLTVIISIIMSILISVTLMFALLVGSVKYQWGDTIDTVTSMESIYSTVFSDIDTIQLIFSVHDYWWVIVLAEIIITVILVFIAFKIDSQSKEEHNG